VTRANVRRRAFYRAELAKAVTPRQRLVAAWRWLLAETVKQGDAGRVQVAARLESIAAEMNGADQ
jgi:cell division protein FtsL